MPVRLAPWRLILLSCLFAFVKFLMVGRLQRPPVPLLLLKYELQVIKVHIAVRHNMKCQELFAGGQM